MISPESFYKTLIDHDVNFFTGIPDSLLKNFCQHVEIHSNKNNHIIAANEGSAIALATGTYLATGNIPLVYMQNSGLGNAINPLTSLADREVYSIPMLLMIGWRGEPGCEDEPQHIKKGRITPDLLNILDIPFLILDPEEKDLDHFVFSLIKKARDFQCPVAILVRKNVFSKTITNIKKEESNLLSREKVIKIIISTLPDSSLFVSSTGHISRELYEARKIGSSRGVSDFLTVGSMGHSSQIALGLALSLEKKTIICLDGDGALLMHMGGLATIGTSGLKNYFHILLNNGVHDSVGGQPTTAGFNVSMTGLAKACGYNHVLGPLINEEDIRVGLNKFNNVSGLRFLEIQVKPGARNDLGRPKESPIENKINFIANIKN
jgi:phosphonopyruvate decarboxylase